MKTAVCLDAASLTALLESEAALDSEAAESVAAYAEHLETCPHCQQTLAELTDDEASWDEAARYLPQQEQRLSGGSSSCELALERGIVQLKTELPLLLSPAQVVSEDDLSLSILRVAEPRPAAHDDRPGLLGYLNDYEVLEVIGHGGMGVVFKALDPALHRLVAIKVIAANVAGSPTVRQRFKREAQAAAAVCHDHIVTVYGVSERDGLPYLVMQYVAGESLQTRLDRTGPLELEEIVRIGVQTASGLAAAHAQGLIHRDIKPANLLLENGSDRVKITDFGLARTADDAQLTQSGAVVGTPEYMAPEQARCEPIDHRADLFSLGSVLYALCTGVAPFRGSPAVAVLRQVSDQLPQPIRELNPDIPAWLEAFIARLMEKDPADRFQSAAEVATLLEGYLAHLRQPETVAAPSFETTGQGEEFTSRPPRLQRRFGLLICLAACFLVCFLGALVLGITRFFPGGVGQPKSAAEDVEKPRKEEHLVVDFRKGINNFPYLTLFGPDADTMAKTDSQGLRITLPEGRPDANWVGVKLPHRLHGDFDIVLGYELLQVGAPLGQYGAGVVLRIWFDAPASLSAALSRFRKPNGEVFGSHKIIKKADGQGQYLNNKAEKAFQSKGKLRLKRIGSQLEYLVAEEGKEYKTLQTLDMGNGDILDIDVECTTMYAPIVLDVRLTELDIRADKILGVTEDSEPSVAVAESSNSNPGQVAGLLLGLVLLVVLMSALGVWLYVRQNHPSEHGVAHDPMPAKPSEAASPISFSCAACGKNLKAKAELAGKKVKCTQCGQAALVPEMMRRGDEITS